jgi:hypothetical protein
MLRTGTPSVNARAWYPPDIGEPGREAHARARMQARAISLVLAIRAEFEPLKAEDLEPPLGYEY